MSNQIVAAELFFRPGVIEVRRRDPAVTAGGRKLGAARDKGTHWEVEPDCGDMVLEARDALEAELILRAAWRLT